MPAPKLLNNVKFFQKCIIVRTDLPAGRQVLALRRDSHTPRRPNCWDLPGGNYEVGEEVNASLRREIREETSLVAGKLFPLYLSSSFGHAYDQIVAFAVCQVCHDWSGAVQLSDEHVEFRWVTPVEFMDLETGDDGGFLKNSLRAYLATLPHPTNI